MATATEKYISNDDENYVKEVGVTDLLAQSFTIGNVGINFAFLISSVDVKLANATTGTVTAEIFNVNPVGEPTGSALSTGTLAASNFDSGTSGKWGRISMSSLTLQPSTKYVLVLSSTINLTSRADGSTPTYTGGETLWSADTGATWTADSDTDLMFQINGADDEGTLCTLGEAISKAGKNAPTNSVNPLLVTQWVKHAESYINVKTEFNWIDDYALQNDDTKYILNKTCSASAAISIVAYDLGGYTDGRVEGETIINILREEVVEGIEALRDMGKKKFIESEKP